MVALRGQVKELRTRQRETDQRLAEIKGTILARESQQETERAAGVGDAYAVRCLCPDKPAACPRAGGNGRGPSASIRSEVIDRLKGELAALRPQRDAAASDLEQVSGQLLFRLNSVLGQPLVTYIEFRVDPQTVRIERARLRGHEVDRVAQQQRALHCARALNEAASAIKDESLRQQFLLAAGSYIDAQERQ